MKKLLTAALAALVAVEAFAAMNYVRPAGQVQLAATADVTAGEIVTVGSSALAYTEGIFAFAQDGTNAVAVGTTMYRAADDAAKVSTTTNSGVVVGVAVGTVDDGSIEVYLNP